MSTEKNIQTPVKVSQEDIEKYGPDPMNHPKLAKLINKELNPSNKPLDTSDIKATNSDLLDEVTICGKQCRAISAGDVSLFERIGNPLFMPDSPLDIETYYFMEVLYVLTNEDIPGMVRASMDSSEWKILVECWAYEIDINDLKDSIDDIEALIQEASEALSGESDGNEDADNSKKNTG